MTEDERHEQNMKVNEEAQQGCLHPAVPVYFRAGFIACREYMARFVEGQDPVIANSIRQNWWPAWGKDFGVPRQLDFKELTEREYGEPGFRCKGTGEVPPQLEALALAWAFLHPANRTAESAPSKV